MPHRHGRANVKKITHAVLLLAVGLHLPAASADDSARIELAKEFVFCSAFFFVAARTAPATAEFEAEVKGLRDRSAVLGSTAVQLADQAFFDTEVQLAMERIRAILEGNRAEDMVQRRKECDSLPARREAQVGAILNEASGQLPTFDPRKAEALSAEKRRQYDLVFFNEIDAWNLDSGRYVTDVQRKRRAEFAQMAQEGYLPAYTAIRLAGIWPAGRRHDPEALEMLLREAERGDASAICAVVVTPTRRSSWGNKDAAAVILNMMREGAAKGHPACMAWYGGALLLGNHSAVPQDPKAAMPLLLDSARQGYYVAARQLFHLRLQRALKKQFDFSDAAELDRAICWGRLAQQQANAAGLDAFFDRLREYARANGRDDLVERSFQFDPQRASIAEKKVAPEECIALERP